MPTLQAYVTERDILQYVPPRTPKYTRPFLTGSWAYGAPRLSWGRFDEDEKDEASDVDLVVLVSPEDLEILIQESDSSDDEKGSYDFATSASLRFGRLNLVCVTNDADFQLWKIGTKALRRVKNLRFLDADARDEDCDAPTRDEAVAVFDQLRKQREEDRWNSPAILKLTAYGLFDGTIQKEESGS